MRLAVVVLLFAILMGVVAICTGILVMALHDVGRRVDIVGEKIDNLRLKSRARMREAAMQSGPRTEEQELERAGRAAAPKRKVVGGDNESAQHRLMRGGDQNEPDTDD